jgi:hypothetical protein
MKSSKNLYFDLKYASHDLCNDISLGKKKKLYGINIMEMNVIDGHVKHVLNQKINFL